MIQKIKSFLFENKSDKQTIIKNTFWLMIAEFFSKGGMFLITILIARILGPEDFGILSFVMSFVAMFVVLTDFGLTTLMVREVSKDHSKIQEYLVNLSFLKVILGFITFILVYVASQFIGKSDLYVSLIMIFAGYSIVNNIGEFIRAFFRPSEKMQYEALLKIINGIITLGIVGASIFIYGDLITIVYGFLISGVINLVISLIYIGKSFEVNFKLFLIKKTLHYFKLSFWFGFSYLLTILYVNIDILMLNYFNISNIDIGYYSSAYKIYSIYIIVLSILSQVMLPKLIGNNKVKIFNKYLLVSSLYGFFILIISIFFSNQIIITLFGNDFSSASIYLILFGFCIFLSGLREPVLYSIISKGHYKFYTILTFLSLLINLIGNIFLIQKHGALGSAIMTLITEIFIFIFLALIFFLNIRNKPFFHINIFPKN